MITQDERESIINEVIERILLMLPELIGNLISNHISLIKLNRDFYKKYPEFSKRKDLVAAVLESIEGNNPNLGYEEILEKAVPEIKNKLSDFKSLDMDTISIPNRNIPDYGDL